MQRISYLALLQKSEPTNQYERDFNYEKFTERKEVSALEQRVCVGKGGERWQNFYVLTKLVSLCKTFGIRIET